MENNATGPQSGDGLSAAERLRQLEAEVERLKQQIPDPPAEEPPIEAPEPSDEPARELTPQELAEVESLIKQAQLAKIRKQLSVAGNLLKKAVAMAPQSRPVLEALGDDYAERRMHQKAAEYYERAAKAGPRSVALERKHADSVYLGQAAMIGLELGGDKAVSGKAAVILSVLLPGVVPMVNGRPLTGWIILIGFVLSLIGTVLVRNNTAKESWVFVGPLLVAVLFWLAGVIIAGGDKEPVRKVDRPLPPSDLPFE